jgi:hypothetical protein
MKEELIRGRCMDIKEAAFLLASDEASTARR